MVQDWAGYQRFRGGFAEALDPERHTIEWLDRQVLSGEFTVWVGATAAIVTSIETYPTGNCDIHGQVASGDLAEIIGQLIPRAEEWARKNGLIGAMISSRPGWAKALKPYGYEVHQISLIKPLP